MEARAPPSPDGAEAFANSSRRRGFGCCLRIRRSGDVRSDNSVSVGEGRGLGWGGGWMLQLPHFLLGKMNGSRGKERPQNVIKVEDEKSRLGGLSFSLYQIFLTTKNYEDIVSYIYLHTKSSSSISYVNINTLTYLLFTKTKCSLTHTTPSPHKPKNVPLPLLKKPRQP